MGRSIRGGEAVGGGSSAPTIYKVELGSDVTLSSATTTYTNITGLTQEVTITNGQIIEITMQGVIHNPTTSLFSCLMRIHDGTTEYDSWYHRDGNTVSAAYRIPVFSKWVGTVGDDITAGTYTFAVQGRNLQSADATLKGGTSEAIGMTIKIYG